MTDIDKLGEKLKECAFHGQRDCVESERQSQSALHSSSQADSRAGQFEFVTFDHGRKHLAQVVAVNGKKITVRRFNKKTGEWRTKNESREREACIPLSAAQAEESFPGSVSAWDKAVEPPKGSGSEVTRQMSPNSGAAAPAAPVLRSVSDFVSVYDDTKKTIDDLADKFAAKAGEAERVQDEILPHLAHMQSLLSKKGPNHDLVVEARKHGHKIPWWTEYYESYKGKLWESLRTMERRIAAYRSDPKAPVSKPERDTDPVPRLNKADRKALIEGNHRANELVAALEAGRDGKTEVASFKAVMHAGRLDDIVQAHLAEPEKPHGSRPFGESGKDYRDREPSVPNDVNVVAKESLRLLESKRHAEKLEAVVEGREHLNPAIRADLIRALEAQANKLLALAKKLKRGFRPLPVAKTGKAHQRFVREHRATLPDPFLEEKRKLAADFTRARVEQISYDAAKNVILANEYLGSMGSASRCFGLYFGEYLGAVVCFGSVAGTKVAASVCGPEHAEKVTVLVRGATEPWAHKHSASHLIAKACDLMAAKGYPIVVAYSDPAAGEVGQIYSAVNFMYTGMTSGTEQFITPDGKAHGSRQIHGLTRDRRNGELKYKRTWAEQRQLLIEQGCKFERVGSKHRYVHFAGDRRTKRLLRKALKWAVLPHPRREARTETASETIDVLAARRFPKRPNLEITANRKSVSGDDRCAKRRAGVRPNRRRRWRTSVRATTP